VELGRLSGTRDLPVMHEQFGVRAMRRLVVAEVARYATTTATEIAVATVRTDAAARMGSIIGRP
jgi:hypothetical protein